MKTSLPYTDLGMIPSLLASIGAINWGLIATINFNLVEFVLGDYPMLVKIVYAIVGISGVYCIYQTITSASCNN